MRSLESRLLAEPNVTIDEAKELGDGESLEVKGSGSKPYVLKNTGGVYSCTCGSWMHQSFAIERRTCKHLKALRGEEAERLRVGGPLARVSGPGAAGSAASASTTPSTTPSVPPAMDASGAPRLLLAHAWDRDMDPTGWWLSEKLDGVRAYWTGTKLVSRLGNTFWAPDWFLESLPTDMHLDGELFGGRKKFQRTVSVVRRQDKSAAWREISFVIFDAPQHSGVFEDRLGAVESLVKGKALPHLGAHPHVTCRGMDHLQEELRRVEGLGGEGLMMRKPGSRYESGRSTTLLKVKTFHDAEAIVTAHLPGAGKHLGRLGALECDLPNGTRFSVGTGLSDAQRDKPPPIGSIITFRYQELTSDGVPRFPTYVGVRHDIAWPPPNASAKKTSPPAAVTSSAATAVVASSTTAVSSTAAATVTRAARVLEKDGVTWEITLLGPSHSIRRRRGLAVKTVTTSFTGPAAAWRDADEQIKAQLAEGWTELPDGED